MTRLSALVVNYDSGAFAVGCVRSLVAEWEAGGRGRDDLEIVVVDNASPSDQTIALGELEALGARIVKSEQNLGYAGGMNLAYESTSGGPDDVVAILNPDLCFLPGSVDAMIDYLAEHPDCGALDPRAYMDAACAIHLPRNPLPTLVEHVRAVLTQRGGRWARAYSRRRVETNLVWWEAREPVEGDMLSGACVFLRRGVVQEMGRPMDPGYPLYFEDTDLFRELKRRGYRLVHHGGAPVVHFWARSSGVAEDFEDGPRARFVAAQRHYYRKWYGSLGYRVMQALDALGRRWSRSERLGDLHDFESLGERAEPVTLELPRAGDFVLELTMTPTFSLAVGILGSGGSWTFPDATWEWLFSGHYYVRALDRRSRELLGAWAFLKTAPGRNLPPDAEELAALRATHAVELAG